MKVTDKITITNEDCMELLKRTPDKFYDLAICDPPYGIGESGDKNHTRSKIAKSKNYKAFAGGDISAPNEKYFKELKRVSKNQIIWGANHFIENIPNANSSSWIVWDKENGENDFADCELAWTSFKTAVRKFNFRWAGMLQGDMKNKEIRIHPTQKPVALFKWLLQNYANRICNHKHTKEYISLCSECKDYKYKILDTHIGSMSIAIACHDMGFELTGCELDSDYYTAGIERIKRHVSQLSLFDPEELTQTKQTLF